MSFYWFIIGRREVFFLSYSFIYIFSLHSFLANWFFLGFLFFRLFFLGVISSFWGGYIVVAFFLIRRFNIKISLFSFFFLSAFLSFPFRYSSFRCLSVLFLFLSCIISENLVKRESPHLLLTGIYSEEMSKIGRLYKKITPLSVWSKIFCQYCLKIISKNA